MKREYERIQSRERNRELWELERRRITEKIEACDQQFELFKPKMPDAVAKVLTVQKKLIEKLGMLCVSFLRSFLSYRYGEEWTRSPSQKDLVKSFSSKPKPVITMELGHFLKTEWQHGGFGQACCEKIGAFYEELDNIVKDMKPRRDTFSDDITGRGELLGYQRDQIDVFLNISVRSLVELKVVLDREDVTSGDFVDNFSREFYKDFGATGLDWRPGNWIFSQVPFTNTKCFPSAFG